MAEEYTRSEYLKALLNQKKTIVNNDSSLLNPSVRNADDVETNYNANVDSSKVSAGSTDIKNETGTSEQYKEDRNGWQRFWDTVGNFVHNINEGVQKYILDPIFDAGAWVYGEISGDKQGATDAINYDWGAHYLNVIDQLDFGTNIMSGDFFGADGGDYWNNWADTGSIEASRQNFANLKAGSFMSDASPEVQQGFETGEQIFGALLPSIILAIATGGSSAGVQAAVFATQVGVAGVSGFGKGVEEALADGGDYDKAGLYGLARGGTDALLAFAGGKISGQLLNGGVGLKAASKVFGKTGSVMLSKAAQIATNAGISGLTAAVDTALVRPAEKLIYDEQAWAKAYGSESATYNTLMNAGKAGLTAVAMSTLSQGITEAGKRASLGQEKYEAQFIRQMDNASSNISKINSNTDKLNKLSDQMSKAYQKLESGAWTEEQYNAYVSTRLNKFEKISAETSKLWDTYQSKNYSDKVVANYGETVGKIKQDNLNAIAYKMSSNNVMPKAKASAFIKTAMDKGYSWSEIKNGGSVQFTSADGNSVIQVGKNESASLMYVAPKTDKKITIPLQIGYNQENYLAPKSALQVTNALTLVALHKSDLVNSMILKPDTLVSKDVNLPNKKNELIITQEVAKKITTDNTGEQIKEFFEVVSKNKGKTVIPNGKEYIIINNYTDTNGIKQTAITKVNSKFDTVMSFAITPTNKVKPSQVATTRTAAMAVSSAVAVEEVHNNEPKYVKAFGEMTHERVISMKKSADIVDIARKQIFSKIAKKDGYTYKLDTPKGRITREIFEAYNGDTKNLPAAIEEIATEIAESKLTALSPTGVKLESLAGHKEDLVKAITDLLEAKSELSKVAKLEKRIDLSIEKKNEQIAKIREKANERLARAYEIFKSINNDLKSQIKEVKAKKDYTNFLSRNRSKIKDLAEGDYTYDKLEDRDVHTINMLSKPLASLERHGGTYKATDKTIEAISTANKIYTEENYEKSIMNYDDTIKRDLEELEVLLRADLGKPELSLETYKALKQYNKDLLAYEQKMVRRVIPERRSRAIATSNEIASYDMSKLQKVLDPITKNLGGKGGELFVKYGYGEITKGQIRILQAHGNNTEWVVKSNEFVSDFLPKGWHSKDNAGKINGVKITKGELIKAYIETHLAPVNAENINYGGYHTEDKQGRPVWFYRGEGHLEQLKADIDALMTPETIKLAENLHYKVINEYFQSKFVDFKKESGYVDVDLVKDYSTLHKDSYFQTSIDKRVIGDPSFRYGLKRTEDLSALGVVDIMDEIGDYIKRIGQQIYLKPAVHDFYALLNSKDSNGISVAQHISEKYGRSELKYLTDITDQWIIKNPESQNFITKVTALFMSGYATSKISSPIRSVKNYLSHTTSNIDLAKMVKLSKYGKEVREAAHMLIDEVIPELKYRSASKELLKGNAPTTFSGISGKIQSIVMSPVKFWDKLAMDSGLLDIVNDCLKNGVDVNSVEGKQYVRDMYSLYNMLNVGSTPLHQNLLNDNAITRMTFNVLAGAMRANVASYAVQGSLYHQFHDVDEVQLKADLEKALAKYEEAQKVTSKAEEAYNNGLKQLDTLREERDTLIENKASKEEIDEARAKVNEQRATNKTLKEDLNNAREEEYKANGEAKTQQNKSDGYKQYKFSGGKRIPLNILAKMIINGIAVTAVGMLANFLYGKKKFSEYKAEEILTTVATNSFLNWIPVVGTLIGTVLHGYEIDAPSISMLNDLGQVAHNIYSSIAEGKVSGVLLTGLISILEGLTGLPIDEIKKYIYGITKLIDPEAALKFNNIFYASTVNGLTKSYNQYVESGDTKSAQAYLSYMVSEFKGGVTNDQINVELVMLSSQGYNAIPTSVPTGYTDEKGNSVQLSSAQITQFTKLYQESTEVVKAIIKSSDYKSATAEEKAKYINAIYSNYYSYAKAKVMGTSGDSKISKLLVLTNGNIDMANYIVYLQKVSTITENKQKTRKESVIDYINRIKGMSKQDKMLLMYLAGYSVNGDSANMLMNYLSQKGMTRNEAKSYLGLEK